MIRTARHYCITSAMESNCVINNQFAETKPDSVLVYGHLNTPMPLLDNADY